jgi:TRAP-type C4-dicarboxylate transport system substrate-binding protein
MKKAIWVVVAMVLIAGMFLATMTACPAPVTQTTTQITTQTTITQQTTITSTVAPEQQIWRYRCYSGSVNSTDYLAAVAAADRILDRTDGAVKLDVFPGGALGYTGSEVPTLIARGFLEAGLCPTDFLGTLEPAMLVMGLPFLYLSQDQRYETIGQNAENYLPIKVGHDPAVVAKIRDMTSSINLRYIDNSTRISGVLTKEPYKIETVEDWQGVHLRAYSATNAGCWEALGSTSIIIPYSEVYSALAADVADGTGGSAGTIRDMSIWEVVKWYCHWPIAPYSEVVTCNPQAYAKLSDANKAIIDEELASIVKAIESDDGWILENSFMPTWTANGLVDVYPSLDDIIAGKELCEANLWPGILADGGADAQELLDLIFEAQA